MKRTVSRTNPLQARGNQLISARVGIFKTDFDQLVGMLRKFTFPQLWTVDDILRVCGLSTNADRVQISRALRRSGLTPVRGTKVKLIDLATNRKIRTFVWHLSHSKLPDFKSASDVRRAYYAERAKRAQSVNAVQDIAQKLA